MLAVCLLAACGSGSSSPTADKAPAADDKPAPRPTKPAPVVQHTDTQRPELPAPVDAAVADNTPAVPVDKQFAAQTRDATWAPATEAEVKKRLGSLPAAHLDSTECRESICKLVVSGTSPAISTAIDAIQSENGGLHGWAQNWILSAPERKGDQLALTAYARFQRSTANQASGED